MKKGELVWDNLGVWILAIILLIILLILAFENKENLFKLLDDLKNVLRFGGR